MINAEDDDRSPVGQTTAADYRFASSTAGLKLKGVEPRPECCARRPQSKTDATCVHHRLEVRTPNTLVDTQVEPDAEGRQEQALGQHPVVQWPAVARAGGRPGEGHHGHLPSHLPIPRLVDVWGGGRWSGQRPSNIVGVGWVRLENLAQQGDEQADDALKSATLVRDPTHSARHHMSLRFARHLTDPTVWSSSSQVWPVPRRT